MTINAAGDTITVSGSELDVLVNDMAALSNDVYLRTPALLENFNLRLYVGATPALMRSFDVVSASYDDAGVALTMVVDVGLLGNTMQTFIANNPGTTIRYELIPRFFRILTGDIADILSDDASVKLRFQATGADAFGVPDEGNILVDFTSDISEFNMQAAGAIQFVRFEVEFDLADGAPLTVDTEAVSVDFLRIPFRF